MSISRAEVLVMILEIWKTFAVVRLLSSTLHFVAKHLAAGREACSKAGPLMWIMQMRVFSPPSTQPTIPQISKF